MKKTVLVFAWIVILGILLGSFAAAAAAADDLAEHLIVHYDFQGDSIEERLSDKATGGKSKENLTIFTTQDENGADLTYVSNGVAHIDTEANNYIACVFDAETGSGRDIYENTSEMTVYVRYQVSGAPTAFGDILDVGNVTRIFAEAASENKLTSNVGLRVTSDAYNSGAHRVPLSDNTVYLGQDTVYVAVTLLYDAEEQSLKVTAHISYDGKVYVTSEKTFAEVSEYYSNSANIALGKTLTGNLIGKNRNYSVDVEDVRIYDMALNLDQIISLNKSGGQEEPTTPADTDPETPTPEVPATTTETPTTTNEPATDPIPGSQETTTGASGTGDKTGCSSAVSVGGLSLILTALLGAGVIKKRKD